MNTNRAAPALASSEVEIAAPAETIWQVLTDIDNWPAWNSAITEASLQGDLEPGSTFRWKAGPGTITSTLREVQPPNRIVWTGKTFGISAVHVHELKERDGRTLVRSEESWEGLPVRVMRGRMQRMLEDSLAPGLEALKREVERRAAS